MILPILILILEAICAGSPRKGFLQLIWFQWNTGCHLCLYLFFFISFL